MIASLIVLLLAPRAYAQVVELPPAAPVTVAAAATPAELSSIEKAVDLVADIRDHLSDPEAARQALNRFDGELKETRLLLAAHGRLNVEEKSRPVVEQRRAEVAARTIRALDRLVPLLDSYEPGVQHWTQGWLRMELARLEQHPFAGPELRAKAADLLDHEALLLPPKKADTFYVNGTSVETLRREFGEYKFMLIFMGTASPLALFGLAWMAREALAVESLFLMFGLYVIGLFGGTWYYGIKKQFVEEAERKAALIPAPQGKRFVHSEKAWDKELDEKTIEEARADLLLGSTPPPPAPAPLAADEKGIIGRRGRAIFSAPEGDPTE